MAKLLLAYHEGVYSMEFCCYLGIRIIDQTLNLKKNK
jgi:hypothetical protein